MTVAACNCARPRPQLAAAVTTATGCMPMRARWAQGVAAAPAARRMRAGVMGTLLTVRVEARLVAG